MTTVPGIDVSYWDAGIDWAKVRAAGQRFVFAKASEGDGYADPTFDDNWRGAKAVGLLRGAYHFFRANVDAKKQANKFIDYVKSMNDDGELPPVLDLEGNDGQGRDKIISRAKTWLDLVEAAFNRKPIIYSGQYFTGLFLRDWRRPSRLGQGLSPLACTVSQHLCGGFDRQILKRHRDEVLNFKGDDLRELGGVIEGEGVGANEEILAGNRRDQSISG